MNLIQLLMKLFSMFFGGNRGAEGSPAGGQPSLLTEMLKQMLGGGTASGDGRSGTGGSLPGGFDGLGGLIEAFKKKGLGDAANSWVGKGQNQPVTPEQIKDVLGSDRLRSLGEKFGMSSDKVTDMLSRHLPKMVDDMTPEGRLPDDTTSENEGPIELPGPRY